MRVDEEHLAEAEQRRRHGADGHLHGDLLRVRRRRGQRRDRHRVEGEGAAAGPGAVDPETAEQQDHQPGAHPRHCRRHRVGLGGEGVLPLLALVAVGGQRGMGQGVVVHLLGETVEQLGGGIEVQPRLFARLQRQQFSARLADARHQAFAAVGEALGEALGVMVGDGAATDLLEQPGDFLQARFERFQHLGGALRAQAFEQLVEGVETGIHGHELAAQANQPAIAQAHVRILEGARRAHRLQAHGLGGEGHVAAFEALAPADPAQAVKDERGEQAEAHVQRIAHRRAGGLRHDHRADHPRAEDRQADFQDPPDRLHEGAFRMAGGGDADQRRGVAGEHAGVGAEVTVAGGPGGAEADPDRRAEQEQHSLLGEQGDQGDHHAEADQGAEDAVEALGEHLAALRLHDDEHGDGRRARLRQFQAHRQPEGQEGRAEHLEHVDPGRPVAARPLGQRAPPLVAAGQGETSGAATHREDTALTGTFSGASFRCAGVSAPAPTPPPRAVSRLAWAASRAACTCSWTSCCWNSRVCALSTLR